MSGFGTVDFMKARRLLLGTVPRLFGSAVTRNALQASLTTGDLARLRMMAQSHSASLPVSPGFRVSRRPPDCLQLS